jgi:hypothetical protein
MAGPVTLDAAASAAEFTVADATPVRDFFAVHPELAAALEKTESWLEPALGVLRGGAPVPKTVTAFVRAPFFRPPTSHRCYYFWPAMPASGEPPGSGSGRAVLAMKGLEPCAPDFPALLEHLRRPCFSPHNMAEHLAIEENKVAGCLSLAEALEESERAAALQIAHLRVYGALARVPLPLLVLRHSPSTEARVRDALRERLSAAAFEVVEPVVRGGLAAYVYYYPTPPVRVKDVDYLLQAFAFEERTRHLRSLCDPEEVVLRFATGVARMLHLGFLPSSLASLHTGSLCQPQNACLDGGFVDLDSLTRFTDLPDDTAMYAGLEFTVDSMLRTLRALVAGSTDPVRKDSDEVRVDLHYLRHHLLARLERALASEARPALVLDPRVQRYFTPAHTFEDLAERLRTYYGSPSPAFEAASRSFGEIGPALVAAARDY